MSGSRPIPLPVLFLATLVMAVGSWCWWRQAPAAGPLTSAPQQYVGHGGTDITFGADSIAFANSTRLTCTNCTASATSLVYPDDVITVDTVIKTKTTSFVAAPNPPEMMLVFGNPITLEVDGSPIAWIEKTGGKDGKPRVRIKDGRVADTVRALLLMTLWQVRERGMTPEVEEWVERLKR